MNLHISKSKNSESFYIAKSYFKENESISSIIIQKLRNFKPTASEIWSNQR